MSDFVRGDEKTMVQLKTKSPLQIKISSVTFHELHYGLFKNPKIKKSTRSAVLSFLEDIEIVSFGLNEAGHAANIRVSLEKEGTPVGAYDLLIAATAVAHNFILVTSNEKEFSRIPDLTIENWR